MLRTYTYSPNTLLATKLAFKQKLWQGTEDERAEKLQELLASLWSSMELEGEPFKITVWPNQEPACRIDDKLKKIFMRKPSVLSALWAIAEIKDLEIPNLWANGLFYKAAPKMYRNSVADGKINYVSLEDLNQMEAGLIPDKLPEQVLAAEKAKREAERSRAEAGPSEEGSED